MNQESLNTLLENITLEPVINPDGSEGLNFTLRVGKSTIQLTSEGDIILNAGRHIILTRQLYFDNCDPSMVDKAINAYSDSKKSYEQFLLSSENKLEYEEASR